MSFIYANGEKIALDKDIVKPNLMPNSKKLNIGGAMHTDFGKFVSIDNSIKGSIYLSDFDVNEGIHAKSTTYMSVEKNNFYTQSFWFTTNKKINPDFSNNVFFTSLTEPNRIFSDIKCIDLGNNHYKVSGYFNSRDSTNFDLLYITNFSAGLKITEPIQIRFDALKIEKGTESTDWCPAYDDYVMQSDLDDIKSQLDQLKSKLGG